VHRFLEGYEPPEETAPRLVGAAVPHAGWRFSGGVAARALKTLAERSTARCLIALGAVHRARLAKAAVYPEGAWETPLGPVSVDAELAARLLGELPDLLEANPAAHGDEHSLEVQFPFLRELFPAVPVVPVLVPPQPWSVDLGTLLARLLPSSDTAAMATTDLTHYGAEYGFEPAGVGDSAHDWMRGNDQRILDLAIRLDAERIPQEAATHWNACGAGALAALVAYARACGAERGVVLERTDSHEVQGGAEPFRMGVGYAGMVF
jgi:AmmeMemoRadiSam system protein B